MLVEIKEIVCDYGLYVNGELIHIFNSYSIALRVKELILKDYCDHMQFINGLVDP